MLFLICPSSQPRPEDRDTRYEMKDIPRISPKTGITFTKALFPGVVYLAKLENNTETIPALVDVKSELLVKIIYSGLAKERYGQDVHMCLAENDMAPRYFTNFCTTLPLPAPPPRDGASGNIPCDGVPSPTFRCIHGLDDSSRSGSRPSTSSSTVQTSNHTSPP